MARFLRHPFPIAICTTLITLSTLMLLPGGAPTGIRAERTAGSRAEGAAGSLAEGAAGSRSEAGAAAGAEAGGQTPAEAGRDADVVELRVLVVLYTSTFSRTLTPGQIARFHQELAEFQHFYEEAAGDRMRLVLHLLRIDRTLGRTEVGEVAPGRYYLAREDVEQELELYGFGGKVDEVIAFYAWDNVNREAAVLAYGGGAVGPDGHFLGDAGFNSQGIFAWDPGRISQIAIHEVLHNLDDMFSRSGMGEGFLNADEMSRNMPLMLDESPGAFLLDYDDSYMLRWAERELRGEEGYPWRLQLIYYRWMLDRTPSESWLGLHYGERVARADRPVCEPLYRTALYAGRPDSVYALVRFTTEPSGGVNALAGARSRGEGADATWASAGPGGVSSRLDPEISDHTDFDGTVIYRIPLYGGFVPRPEERQETPDSLVLSVSSLGVRAGTGVTFRSAPWEPVRAAAAPEPGWGLEVEGTSTAQVGRPFTLYLRARERAGVEDASIRVRLGEDVYEAIHTGAGAYEVHFPSLPPGTPELVVEATRSGGAALEERLMVPVEYRGTITAPARIAGRTGDLLSIEAGLRDRMGHRVTASRVPLVLVVGSEAISMRWQRDRGDPATYLGMVELPPGTHRLVVASLEGTGLYRRLVNAEISAEAGARGAVREPVLGGAILPADVAVAPRRSEQVTVNGDLSEWSRRPSFVLGPDSQVLTDPALYDGAGDLQADVWFAWEPGALHVAGHVRDDVVTHGDQWDSDRLNLVFDMNNDTTPLTYGEPTRPAFAVDPGRWNPDDYWVLARLFSDERGSPGSVMRIGGSDYEEMAVADFEARRTAEGYDFELSLPAAALPGYGDGFPGKVVGLQVFFTDGDAETTITELMWAGRWGYDANGIHWEIPRKGRLLFTGAPLR